MQGVSSRTRATDGRQRVAPRGAGAPREPVLLAHRRALPEVDAAAAELDHRAGHVDPAVGVDPEAETRVPAGGRGSGARATRRVQVSPARVTGTRPAARSSTTRGLSPATTLAVPSVGCPANGSSASVVKIRTRASARSGLSLGRTNVV